MVMWIFGPPGRGCIHVSFAPWFAPLKEPRQWGLALVSVPML